MADNPFTHEKRRRLTPPERAKLFALANGHCQKCTRKIPHGDDWDVEDLENGAKGEEDHVQALSRGGTNKFPDNWQLLCSWCHGEKTSDDLSAAAKSKRIFTRHVVPARHMRSRSWGRKW